MVENGRARAVVVQTPDGLRQIEAGTIVLASGAYGSPAILLRSGIGPADELRALGIDVVADLAGVGRDLVDHPAVHVRLTASTSSPQLAADDERGILTHVQSKLKAASSRCAGGTFDLHVLPNVGWERDAADRPTGRHQVSLIPVVLKPAATASCA